MTISVFDIVSTTDVVSVNPPASILYPQSSTQTTVNFSYTGSIQSFTVPGGVSQITVTTTGGGGATGLSGGQSRGGSGQHTYFSYSNSSTVILGNILLLSGGGAGGADQIANGFDGQGINGYPDVYGGVGTYSTGGDGTSYVYGQGTNQSTSTATNGASGINQYSGGNGGIATATFSVKPGDIFYYYVGKGGTAIASGYPAGGDGSISVSYYNSPFDSETITESYTSLEISNINIFDSESIAEFTTIGVKSYVTTLFPSQIGVSGYKHETSTLYNAQNQFTVRPSLICQIVDDTFLVNDQLYNNNSSTSGFSADTTLAPDGTILAIGSDNSGNLVFTQVSDGTQLSEWNKILNGTGTVLVVSNSWSYYNPNITSTDFHLNPSIEVSDWINGGYIADVYYWWYDAGTFDIYHLRGTYSNGSWSWASSDITGSIGVQNNAGFISLTAGKPIYDSITGNTSACVFCVDGSDGTANPSIVYVNYIANGVFNAQSWYSWGNIPNYANSSEWYIHSLDSQYINGTYYVVFSGYHTTLESTNSFNQVQPSLSSSTITQSDFFGNFGIYIMEVQQITNFGSTNSTGVIFTEPREVLSFNSSSNTNLNQALYPGLFYDGEYLWLTFRADVVQTVSSDLTATTTTNYYICKSKDFWNFDYPTIINDTAGNSIVSPGTTSTNGVCRYSLVGSQNGFYYLWGDGALWQFIQNNVIADVSNDILSIQIQDQSGGASSINLTINNANGKWGGTSPSGNNYSAIWKNGIPNVNSKIYLRIGYYTTAGSETIPKSIYYITDITQKVGANANDLVIVGQDFNHLLSITKTAFSYTFTGPDLYYDGFNNNTLANWNSQSGLWQQVSNLTFGSYSYNAYAPYTTYKTTAGSELYELNGNTFTILNGYAVTKTKATLSVIAYLPASSVSGAKVSIYPWYVDSNNYIEILLEAASSITTLYINQAINGSVTTINQSSLTSFTISSADWYPIYITLYDFAAYIDVMIGQNGGVGNEVGNFTFSEAYYSGTLQQVNPYSSINGKYPTIALGTSGDIGSVSSKPSPGLVAFANFKFVQYDYSQTIEQLTKKLATKAHIFDYVSENDYVQDLYDITQWTSSGAFSLLNRQINLGGQAFALQNTTQYGNGRMEFDAKLDTTATDDFGFDIILRSTSSSDLSNCFKLRIMNAKDNNGNVFIKASLLESVVTSMSYTDQVLFSSVIPDILNPSSSNTTPYTGNNNLYIDLSNWNHFSVDFNKGWYVLYVNEVMVFAWYDNNNTLTQLGDTQFISGYFGFSTVNAGAETDPAFTDNETLYVKNIYFPTFWHQNPAFTLNPGDDITSAIQQNLQTQFGWFFSDLGGNFKIINLKSTDPVTYNYGDSATNYLLYGTSIDSSNKEYYNQVLVVGDGVSAIATDNTSVGSNGILREEVIVDYTITTETAAQSRANQELTNIKKYGAQPAPTLQINPGSEIFDVVNVIDKSTTNTTALDGNYRNYTQSFNIDNQSHYSITLGLGDVSDTN